MSILRKISLGRAVLDIEQLAHALNNFEAHVHDPMMAQPIPQRAPLHRRRHSLQRLDQKRFLAACNRRQLIE